MEHSPNLRIFVIFPYRQEPQQQTCPNEGVLAADLLIDLAAFGDGYERKLEEGAGGATSGPFGDEGDGPLMEMLQHVVCKGTAVRQTATESNQNQVRHRIPRVVRKFTGFSGVQIIGAEVPRFFHMLLNFTVAKCRQFSVFKTLKFGCCAVRGGDGPQSPTCPGSPVWTTLKTTTCNRLSQDTIPSALL